MKTILAVEGLKTSYQYEWDGLPIPRVGEWWWIAEETDEHEGQYIVSSVTYSPPDDDDYLWVCIEINAANHQPSNKASAVDSVVDDPSLAPCPPSPDPSAGGAS